MALGHESITTLSIKLLVFPFASLEFFRTAFAIPASITA